MRSLDLDEERARAGHAEAMPPSEVVGYLRDLPRWWDQAPRSRRALAEALFERIEVLGLRTMRVTPTPAAVRRGLIEAVSFGSGGYGRGGGSQPAANRLILYSAGERTTVTLVVDHPPLRAVESA